MVNYDVQNYEEPNKRQMRATLAMLQSRHNDALSKDNHGAATILQRSINMITDKLNNEDEGEVEEKGDKKVKPTEKGDKDSPTKNESIDMMGHLAKRSLPMLRKKNGKVR